MDRGSVVLVSAKGEYGKTRPAVVVQDARMADIVGSITVCFMTSDLSSEARILRIDIEPSAENGLRERSQVQVEKVMTFPREKVRGPIGRLAQRELASIDVGLMVHLGLVSPLSAERTRGQQ